MGVKTLLFPGTKQAPPLLTTSSKESSKFRRLAKFVKAKAQLGNKQDRKAKTEAAGANPSQALLESTGIKVRDFALVSTAVEAPVYPTPDSSQDTIVLHPIPQINSTTLELGSEAGEVSTTREIAWESLVNEICKVNSNSSKKAVINTPTTLEYRTRQVSTSTTSTASTLSVSLRSRASEPCLRRGYVGASLTPYIVEPLDGELSRLREQKIDRTWNVVLQNQETSYKNEIAALQDEHEDELKNMQGIVDKVTGEAEVLQKRKVFLQKQLKKEVLKNQGFQEALQLSKEQEAHHQARDTALTEENARLLGVISDIQARNADYIRRTETLTAERQRDQEKFGVAMAQMKGEWDHAQFKLAELDDALKDNPMADRVDQKGLIDLKTHQIENLEKEVHGISNYASKLERESRSHKVKCSREAEKLTADLQHSLAAENDQKERLDILQKAYDELASCPRYELRHSKEVKEQATEVVIAQLRDNAVVLQTAKYRAAAAQTAAEEDVRRWRHRYEDLCEEHSKKGEEIGRLENANRHLDNETSRVDIELNAVTMEKEAEITARDQRITVLEGDYNLLMEHIDRLGHAAANDRAEWVLQLKTAEINSLKQTLEEAKAQMAHCAQALYEKDYTARTEVCFGWYQDDLMSNLNGEVRDTREECANLRKINRDLLKAQENDRRLSERPNSSAKAPEGRASNVTVLRGSSQVDAGPSQPSQDSFDDSDIF
ncbi:GRIP and coiled-coil domain-containing protein 2 [Lambiella insularis]|nr:GRIP and coiled-coil domain-containing protein 2 [Lambiella insularis]